MTQFAGQSKMSSISQLTKGILRALQKLLRYFSGTIISTSTLPGISPLTLSVTVWLVIFALKLNESVALAPLKSTIAPPLFTAGISVQYFHKPPDVFE